MADLKITGLTADVAPTTDDLVVTVNDPAGTPANKKVTLSNLSLGLPLASSTSSNVATDETTTSTSYTGLATAQAITVTVGPSGMLLIGYGAQMYNTTANYMAYALSGGTTYASSDNDIAMTNSNQTAAMVKLHTGLAAGSTTITAQFRVDSGTGHWLRRHLWAIPL